MGSDDQQSLRQLVFFSARLNVPPDCLAATGCGPVVTRPDERSRMSTTKPSTPVSRRS